MHDLDRAMFEGEDDGPGTTQTGHSEQSEFLEVLGQLTNGSGGRDAAARFDRSTGETELATELLEVTEAQELDQFLGRLLSRAAGAASDFARSDTGKALGGILKTAAGQALPVIGRGIGGAIGPQYADLGDRVGRGASVIFGLELEGMSLEDREFEVAKAFVRFASAAAKQAATAPAGAPPAAVARASAITAARHHAPGLLKAVTQGATTNRSSGARQHSGRWQRRGNQIVIFGS